MDDEKKESIRDFFEVMELRGKVRELFDTLLEAYREIYTDLPEAVWDDVEAEMTPDFLLDELEEMYDDAFTTDDMKKLSEFFSTDVGRKYRVASEEISQEMAMIGMNIGADIERILMERSGQGEDFQDMIEKLSSMESPEAGPPPTPPGMPPFGGDPKEGPPSERKDG